MHCRTTGGFLFVSMVCAAAFAALAAEQTGDSMERKATPAASAPSAQASTAPSQPASAAPVQMAMAGGSIRALDLKSVPATLTLAASDGKTESFMVEPGVTIAWKNGQAIQLSELKIGDTVKVRSTAKDGRSVAKSIQVEPAPKTTAASPASPSTKTPY